MNSNNSKFGISVIVPVFNEQGAILAVINDLRNFFKGQKYDYEIIVVNDASSDRTAELLKSQSGIKLINHPYNKGYGAALKTGARNAQYEWILWFDSDGQHKTTNLPPLLEKMGDYDMVVGARVNYGVPLLRIPGKKILNWLANFLVGKKIPDLNSGLRLVKKDLFSKFTHIFPNSFSISTTSTLAFFKEGLNVAYVPIRIKLREEKSGSSVRIVRDGIQTILLILRVIMLFNPLKIFMPISLIFLVFGSLFSIYGAVFYGRMPNSGVFILLTGIILFFNGLLADQLASLKRRK